MIYKLILRTYEYLIWRLTRPEFVERLINRFDESESNQLQDKINFQKQFKRLGLNSDIPVASFINNPKYISIGDNFGAWHNLRIEAIDYFIDHKFDPEIIIGDNVSIGSDCHIGCIGKIVIGNNVLMAGRVFITDHFHGQVNEEDIGVPPSKRMLYSKGPVMIMDNVWIGEGVCIMPNVTIGANSIIGANSVVTKSFEKNSVVAGNPANLLRILK